jgi:hypothetical protein
MPFIVLSPADAQAAPTVTIGAPLISQGETLESMRNDLDLELGSRPDVDEDRLDRWINRAYFDMATALQFPELEGSFELSTVAAEHLYLVPSHLLKILDISLTLDRSYFRRLRVSDGDPKIYHRTGSLLVIYPAPEEVRAIAIDARFRPIALTAAHHSPVFGQEWHEGVQLLARVKAHKALLEWDLAREAENEWTAWMRRREDPAGAEDEGRVIKSSVPHKYGYGKSRNRVIGYEAGDPWL